MHSLADRYLSCFTLAVITNVLMNSHAQVLVWIYVFISPGYTPRSRTVESYDNSMFNILTVFQSGCVTFHFHQQCMGVPISLRSQHLLLCHFYSSHAGGYDVVSHGGFDLHYPGG